MKTTAAVVMGFLSGCLIYMTGGVLWLAARDKSLDEMPVAGLILLFVGWGASIYLLQKGAQTASRILARGFLLGAAEWSVMICAQLIRGLYVQSESGLFLATIATGLSLCMAFTCLAGFAVVHFWRRETSP